MEDPFNQSGLDDIKIEEFDSRLPSRSAAIQQRAPVAYLGFGQLPQMPPVGQFATRNRVQI